MSRIVNNTLNTNISHQELIKHENNYLSFSEFITIYDEIELHGYPMHWHSEAEIVLQISGSTEYTIDNKIVNLNEGEALFISPTAVHSARAIKEHSISYDIVFGTSFLVEITQDIGLGEYVLPIILHKPSFTHLSLGSKHPTRIIETLKDMYNTDEDVFANDLLLIRDLIKIWRSLILILSRNITEEIDGMTIIREKRIRNMMAFIRNNYDKQISVESIAASAGISKSECFRCFSLIANISPSEYLTQYRMRQATQMLLELDISINEISTKCGFKNNSYFTKSFKNIYQMTPSEWRKANVRSNFQSVEIEEK